MVEGSDIRFKERRLMLASHPFSQHPDPLAEWCCCLHTPLTFAMGGGGGGGESHIQGWQRGAYVAEVEEILCVGVSEGE